jgi:Chitin binding Peritrophin-A domain
MFPKLFALALLANAVYASDTQPDYAGLCSGKSLGAHIPHPQHCNRYYVCSRQGIVAFTCSGNLLFNRVNGVCDWPEKVNCNTQLPDQEYPGACNGGCNKNCCSSCNQNKQPCSCSAKQSLGMKCICLPIMCIPCKCPCPCPPQTSPVRNN